MKKGFRRHVTLSVLTASYIVISYLVFLDDNTDTVQQVLWRERQRAVEDYCQVRPVSLPTKRPLQDNNSPKRVLDRLRNQYKKELVVNIVHIPQLNLNWCLVPKVASTSISAAILPHLRLGRDKQEFPYLQKEVWSRAGKVKYEQYQAQQNVTPSFLITRHPFARLASAFRNKLEDRTRSHDGEYFYNTYSKQIIEYARGQWNPSEAEPTFAEFVHYLINTDVDQYDEHWQPISIRCRVCQLHYSHILHYEKFEEEWKQFVKELKLEKELQLPWENKGSRGSLKSYYDLITPEERYKLYTKYQPDFQMFGYDINDEI